VALNRPEKMNAMNNLMWEEIGAVFDRLARDPDCRAIVLRWEGRGWKLGYHILQSAYLYYFFFLSL
jgi:delta(3,5)-delta(2,4)-dienoyl-CoA isomerase